MKVEPFNIKCYNYLYERFQYLFEEQLINEICFAGNLKTVEENRIIIDIGDAITHMPLIVSGSIKVMTEDNDENELLLYYLELGDTCAMTLNCCTRSAKSNIRAQTEEPTEILMIPVEKMDEWMVKFSSWRGFVLESYNSRLNEMLRAVDNLAFDDIKGRLRKYLLEKSIVSKDKIIAVTQYEIARDLNTSRVVISRLLKKLDQEGIIRHKRNQIEIVNITFTT